MEKRRSTEPRNTVAIGMTATPTLGIDAIPRRLILEWIDRDTAGI
jgi:hypothetical protein